MLFAADALLFRSGWYARRLEPDSSTANIERIIRLEREKQSKPARHQIVAVGDSRMGFFVRFANERWGGEGFRFGTLALGGALPRCWPYLLRAVDPDANRYSAVIVPLNDFDDIEIPESYAERVTDLNYLAGQLRVTDLPEFAGSFTEWPSRWQAVRAILFKGFAYKRDVQSFLEQPKARLAKVELYKEWEQWVYNYKGEARSLAGLEIDHKNKKVTLPADVPADVRSLVERLMLADPAPDRGAMAAYRRHWLGKLVDHYRGSKTRVIFIRLPRGPLPPDPVPASNPAASVRQLARQPQVTLVEEHFFDSLEKPELFMDPLHLNGAGIERFTVMLADEARRIVLGSQGKR